MELTIALNRYDRHVPFFNGTVTPPDGFSFRPFEVGESTPMRDGDNRHARMMNGLEFDVCEMSFSSFVVAVARNPDLALVGVPAFPRRLFSLGQMYVNIDAGIDAPADLIGRNVGLHSFQTTLSVLAKGDLKLDYGVDWEDINWHCARADTVPVKFKDGVSIQRIPDGADIGTMLAEGEIDALFSPHPPKSLLARPDRYRRLFADARTEEKRYYDRHGYFPIMHIMTLKRELADANPALPRQIMAAWEEAKQIAYRYYDDTAYTLLAWGRTAFEGERKSLGEDPWPTGFSANRKNLEQFIAYEADQGLIEEPFPAERLFHPSVLDG